MTPLAFTDHDWLVIIAVLVGVLILLALFRVWRP